MCLRYLTAGESHGPALVGILDGMPAGVSVNAENFSSLLRKRQAGYGRGPRSQSQPDEVEVISGVVAEKTTGSPVALMIKNHNPVNLANSADKSLIPLPGHADLPGTIKYRLDDCRLIRERASARETAMRVALSVPPRSFLHELGIRSTCFIDTIGSCKANVDYEADPQVLAKAVEQNGDAFLTPDAQIIPAWSAIIDQSAKKHGSLGGAGSVIFWNLPIGLGSHAQFDRRLDALLAGLVMSIPAVKGVEISGYAADIASQPADAIFYDSLKGYHHRTNHAGGLEGGMSNGSPLIIRFFMKPLPANAGLPSVNLGTGEEAYPSFYRSDTHALAAAAIAAESIVAVQLASEILKVTGGDHLDDVRAGYHQIFRRQR